MHQQVGTATETRGGCSRASSLDGHQQFALAQQVKETIPTNTKASAGQLGLQFNLQFARPHTGMMIANRAYQLQNHGLFSCAAPHFVRLLVVCLATNGEIFQERMLRKPMLLSKRVLEARLDDGYIVFANIWLSTR